MMDDKPKKSAGSLARYGGFFEEDAEAILGNPFSLTDGDVAYVPPRTLEELDQMEEDDIPPKSK